MQEMVVKAKEANIKYKDCKQDENQSVANHTVVVSQITYDQCCYWRFWRWTIAIRWSGLMGSSLWIEDLCAVIELRGLKQLSGDNGIAVRFLFSWMIPKQCRYGSLINPLSGGTNCVCFGLKWTISTRSTNISSNLLRHLSATLREVKGDNTIC